MCFTDLFLLYIYSVILLLFYWVVFTQWTPGHCLWLSDETDPAAETLWENNKPSERIYSVETTTTRLLLLKSEDEFPRQHHTPHSLRRDDNWLGCKCLTYTNKTRSWPQGVTSRQRPGGADTHFTSNAVCEVLTAGVGGGGGNYSSRGGAYKNDSTNTLTVVWPLTSSPSLKEQSVILLLVNLCSVTVLQHFIINHILKSFIFTMLFFKEKIKQQNSPPPHPSAWRNIYIYKSTLHSCVFDKLGLCVKFKI